MNTTAPQTSRPLAVKLALVLLLINLSAGFAQQAISADWRSADWGNPLHYVKWGSQLIMMAVPLWFIFRGRNWARWLLVVIAFAGFCFSVPQLIQDFQAHSYSWIIAYFQTNLITGAALVLLFLPSSNQWFREYKNANAAAPPNGSSVDLDGKRLARIEPQG